MRAKNNLCAVFHKIFDGGKRAHNTVFVGYNAVFHRHVEIASYKASFAFNVNVSDRLLVHKLKTPLH